MLDMPGPPRFAPSALVRSALPAIVLLGTLVALSFGLSASAPRDAAWQPDSRGYVTPAQALLETGVYTSDRRLPGYPLLIALVRLLPNAFPGALIALQTGLLLASGLLAGAIAGELGSRRTTVAFLTVLSPYAVFLSRVILPDMLFLFLFLCHVLLALRARAHGSIALAVSSGLLWGLLSLVRVNGLLIGPASAGVVVALDRLAGSPGGLGRLASRVALPMLVAGGLPILSFMLYNHAVTGQLRFVPPGYRAYAVSNLVQLEAVVSGVSVEAARRRVFDAARSRAGIAAEGWEPLATSEKDAVVEQHVFQIARGYSAAALLRAALSSMVRFHAGTGLTSIVGYYLGSPRETSARIRSTPSRFDRWIGSGAYSAAHPILSLLIAGFFAATRVLAVGGAFVALRRRRFPLLLVVLAYVAYFTASSAFLAMTRYRQPVEPFVFMLAALCLHAVWELRSRRPMRAAFSRLRSAPRPRREA